MEPLDRSTLSEGTVGARALFEDRKVKWGCDGACVPGSHTLLNNVKNSQHSYDTGSNELNFLHYGLVSALRQLSHKGVRWYEAGRCS